MFLSMESWNIVSQVLSWPLGRSGPLYLKAAFPGIKCMAALPLLVTVPCFVYPSSTEVFPQQMEEILLFIIQCVTCSFSRSTKHYSYSSLQGFSKILLLVIFQVKDGQSLCFCLSVCLSVCLFQSSPPHTLLSVSFSSGEKFRPVSIISKHSTTEMYSHDLFIPWRHIPKYFSTSK